MFYTYVLQSAEGKFYIGYTSNLQKRLEQHNAGISKWTRRYTGWKVVYQKVFQTRSEAINWEKYLKKQKGGNGLLQIINKAKEQSGS